jgi:hypothetical protein
MNPKFAANNYKSVTIFDAHEPFTVADGVLIGAGYMASAGMTA